MASVVTLGAATAIAAFGHFGKYGATGSIDPAWLGPSMVPETYGPVGETIRIPTCRHDWRACTDNRDWAGSSDRTGPQRACRALAEEASRLGDVAWDRAQGGPRFDSYLGGTSIRRGYIVLADHGALVRGPSGGWVHATVHCGFDFVTWTVYSFAPA